METKVSDLPWGDGGDVPPAVLAPTVEGTVPADVVLALNLVLASLGHQGLRRFSDFGGEKSEHEDLPPQVDLLVRSACRLGVAFFNSSAVIREEAFRIRRAISPSPSSPREARDGDDWKGLVS